MGAAYVMVKEVIVGSKSVMPKKGISMLSRKKLFEKKIKIVLLSQFFF